jgi:hypothetical protein
LIASPVLIVAAAVVSDWSLAMLASVGALFAAIYVPVGARIVLTPTERRRFSNSFRRRLGLRTPARQGAPSSETSTTTGL